MIFKDAELDVYDVWNLAVISLSLYIRYVLFSLEIYIEVSDTSLINCSLFDACLLLYVLKCVAILV